MKEVFAKFVVGTAAGEAACHTPSAMRLLPGPEMAPGDASSA